MKRTAAALATLAFGFVLDSPDRRYSLSTKRVSPRYSMLSRGAGRGRRRRSDLPSVNAPPA